MHRVILTGGPALMRDAYAHIIEGSPLLTVQAQVPALDDALTQLPSLRPDILLIDALAFAPRPRTATLLALRQAAPRTALAVVGDTPAEDISSLLNAGVTGILSHDVEATPFMVALDLVRRGGLVISSAPPAARTSPILPNPLLEQLSTRERQVLALVASQADNKALAQLLGLSPLTVKSHVSRILRKLGASTRAQLVAIAYESGLVTPGLPAARAAR
ncbi:LuxR C-terminal-related transcriptional regulator [Streptomyces collinus]|uniref:response regulator transcription factor n=1 Tax=Streptomyces collinus TaxID=42684 RepID=UPI0036764305